MQDENESRNAFLAFAIVGAGATLWALGVCAFAIWWHQAFGGAL